MVSSVYVQLKSVESSHENMSVQFPLAEAGMSSGVEHGTGGKVCVAPGAAVLVAVPLPPDEDAVVALELT